MRSWVADASPLILLAKVDQVHLLEQLPDVLVIPASVAKEVRSGPKRDPARQWLDAKGAGYIEPIPSQVSEVNDWDLGRGESAVLSWARHDASATAIVDDLAARRCAQALGIRVTGTIGVVLAAKRAGLVTRVGVVLDALVEAGLRITRTCLQRHGSWPMRGKLLLVLLRHVGSSSLRFLREPLPPEQVLQHEPHVLLALAEAAGVMSLGNCRS